MRYLVFAGDGYYPAGGINDLVGRCDTLSEANVISTKYSSRDWCHIYDNTSGKEIEPDPDLIESIPYTCDNCGIDVSNDLGWDYSYDVYMSKYEYAVCSECTHINKFR